MPARWILCGQADEYSDDDEKKRGRGKEEEEDRGALPNGHEHGPNKGHRGLAAVASASRVHRASDVAVQCPRVDEGPGPGARPFVTPRPSLLRDRHDDLVDLHAILVLGEPGLVGPV